MILKQGMAQPQRRRELQEKEAYQNITISVPYFISSTPSKIIAISRNLSTSLPHPYQQKIYHNGHHFITTRVIYFDTQQSANSFYRSCQERLKNQKGVCDYCKDLSKMEGILYQTGKIYVPYFENKQLRQFLNDVSQLVVVGGAATEQLLRHSKSPLFSFLEENTLSLQQIYYRWRVYSYLQGDGQKRFRTEPFKMIQAGNEWFPPGLSSIQRNLLSAKQRKYFHQLIFSLTRKKQSIEQAMSFCIFNIANALEIATIITLEIFEKLKEDFIPLMYLISDILFNTTTHTYRRLFGRMVPFIVYYYGKEIKSQQNKKQIDLKYRGELKALIRIWEMKFIFDENYTQGLLFLLNSFEGERKQVQGIHEKLKAIANLEQSEGEISLEKMCFQNGIPLIENEKEQSMSLINQYLWQFQKQETIQPEIVESCDGEPITDKDLIKIKAKQVKVLCSQGLNISILLEKNWQTKSKNKHSVSVDQSGN